MNIFAVAVLDSPTVATSREAFQFLVDNAGKSDMTRFYLYIAIGLVATFLVQWMAVLLVRRLLRNSPRDVIQRVAGALRMPLGLLTFSYFFILAFDAITAMPHELWQHVHSDLYPILNGLLILICSFRLVDIIAQVLRKRWEGESTNLDERWADLIGLTGKTIVSVGAGLFIIQKIDPSFNILPLLTGVSFVGAAVALASQSTIANAIGSMEIMIDRLFKEGDRISFGEYDGFVVRMGLRSITLAALTGEKINLPNKDLVDKQIRNFTRGKFNRTNITVGVLYDVNRAGLERALGLLETIIRANPHVDSCETSLHRFADSSVELQAIFWADYKTSQVYNRLMSDVQLALKEAFDKEGIAFAFPTQTVYLKKE
jgi:MscS family membrane protein